MVTGEKMKADIWMKDVTKKYGDLIAVNRLDLQVNRGEIFCLVGPNAAGKTTTIQLLLGILKAEKDSDSIKVRDLLIPKEKKKILL